MGTTNEAYRDVLKSALRHERLSNDAERMHLAKHTLQATALASLAAVFGGAIGDMPLPACVAAAVVASVASVLALACIVRWSPAADAKRDHAWLLFHRAMADYGIAIALLGQEDGDTERSERPLELTTRKGAA